MCAMRAVRRLAAAAAAAEFLVVALVAVPQAASALDPSIARQVDAVFAPFDTSATPGCAAGVMRDGALAYARGYGQASVELGVPITPRTVFDIGSVSKQFTTMAVMLLAEDGKLSLDDDVRKYLPEIPSYDRPVTIRHLLQHTSGLRDYTMLLPLADFDLHDVTTVPQALGLLARQRGADFAAGGAFRYNNTGFFLASLIVERVSGQTLAAFAAARIFGPLGMTATRYAGSQSISVPGRATGYAPEGGGSIILMSNWEQTGDGAVQTSVEDMTRWVANFDTHVVGTAATVTAMETTGRLTSGEGFDYGLGQFVGAYRGVRRIHHGGSWAGFKAALQRYPSAKTAVIVLCNRAEVNPEALADRVSDAVLADSLGPAPAADAVPALAMTGDLSRFAGTYWSETSGQLLSFEAKDGALAFVSGDRRTPLTPWGAGRFMALRPYRMLFTFTLPPSGAASVTRIIEERERLVATRQAKWTPSAADLARLAGTWQSDELDADYVLRADGERLVRVPRRGEAEPLVPAFDGVFGWGSAVIRFSPDRSTFEVLAGGTARGIVFTRR
jgi:CubicO group peptidase (beta-lactamase class C family)